MKCEFILFFNDYEFCPYVESDLYCNKTMCFWQKFLEMVIEDFNNRGYTFSHIAEKNFITLAKKLDMSYDFYTKHNMHDVERKLIMMINKDKTLINKLNQKWRHPLISKHSHVLFNN